MASSEEVAQSKDFPEQHVSLAVRHRQVSHPLALGGQNPGIAAHGLRGGWNMKAACCVRQDFRKVTCVRYKSELFRQSRREPLAFRVLFCTAPGVSMPVRHLATGPSKLQITWFDMFPVFFAACACACAHDAIFRALYCTCRTRYSLSRLEFARRCEAPRRAGNRPGLSGLSFSPPLPLSPRGRVAVGSRGHRRPIACLRSLRAS